MSSGRGVARRSAVLAPLLALVLLAAGCELVVDEPRAARDDAQRNAMSTAVADLPEYDVAVSAIDFDPPLRRGTLLSTHETVKLLAAVENKGTMPLSHLVVEARVISQKGDFSAQDRVQIDRLSPGETRVVEFQGVAPVQMVPQSPSYRISVTVNGQPSNPRLRSNSRDVVVRVVEASSPRE